MFFIKNKYLPTAQVFSNKATKSQQLFDSKKKVNVFFTMHYVYRIPMFRF